MLVAAAASVWPWLRPVATAAGACAGGPPPQLSRQPCTVLLGATSPCATAGVARPVSLHGCCLQAGAAKVYAVEASGMAQFAKQLAAANPGEAPVWLCDQPAASQAASSLTF